MTYAYDALHRRTSRTAQAMALTYGYDMVERRNDALPPDRLGTPTIVSGDGSSLDVAETEYLAYGEGTPSTTSFGLADTRYDPEGRLYHVGARDYDPRQERFVQPDLIGTLGGVNLYAYVGNDSLNASDEVSACIREGFDGDLRVISVTEINEER